MITELFLLEPVQLGVAMRLQVLLSAMNIEGLDFLDEMNIQSDMILINQGAVHGVEAVSYRGHTIEIYSFRERGIGLSRNTALMRANADIVLFADDDCAYVDGYCDIVLQTFHEHPEADIIFFNLDSLNAERQEPLDHSFHRVYWCNCLKYGACRIAARLEKVRKANVFFSLLFGGGARYSAGEDSLFIMDCLKRGLRLYASPKCIGTVRQEMSTWFQGYTKKYYHDRGALFCAISPCWAHFLSAQFVLRYREDTKAVGGIWQAWKLMRDGVRAYAHDG